MPRRSPLPFPDSLLQRQAPQPDGCIYYTGSIRKDNGYGRITIGGETKLAHRVAYELHHGPIPSGREVDHACHNDDLTCVGGKNCLHRRCVNPDHLEAVEHRENNARGRSISALNGLKTHCVHGHPFDEANTHVYRGHRSCRRCRADRERKRRASAKLVR